MADNKTLPTACKVLDFVQSIDNKQKQVDALGLLDIFAKVTKQDAVMWGSSIIGYGTYSYQTADKKTHQFMRTGFSPRKNNLALYIMVGFSDFEEKLQQLGKFKTGKSCLYINRLSDVNERVLEELIELSLVEMARRYPV
ncbi:DUF1801 domain-containing protein [uncultured Paraglaciecola sp.]|uniref:DUF1801 domain-containing protein n=1 Tax=uncultured Paraglaciecola sp. TaxID=1765024 RepID=UPI0030DB2A3C|tara:strand:+ start:55705 stop:56124 length:420 start_codon:yes stop_codon:yes gene_type:complete